MAIIESDNAGKWSEIIRQEATDWRDKSSFMRLSPRPEPYVVHLMSVPSVTRRHWSAFKEERYFPVSPAINRDKMAADIAWCLGGWVPPPRFTAVVMDRSIGSPRIMDFGKTVFEGFAEFYKISGVDPCGRDSPDFRIRVEGGNMPMNRGYMVAPVTDPSSMPLTDQEMNKAIPLIAMASQKVKAAKPVEIRDRWMSLPMERKYSPHAIIAAKARPGAGSASRDQVISYISKYGDDVFVPVIDGGKGVNAPISNLDGQWKEAYMSYYIDFGILPNRYLTAEKELDEIADRIMDDDDIATRWLNPNAV